MKKIQIHPLIIRKTVKKNISNINNAVVFAKKLREQNFRVGKYLLGTRTKNKIYRRESAKFYSSLARKPIHN
jgi:hypothetical protein